MTVWVFLMFEVFWRFLWLGFISFGGPAAHLGYFQRYFVQQHRWLDKNSYAHLVALGQFLPGPASSQVGFAIGLERAGLLGGIAAFVGFTLPSFTIMVLLVLLGEQWFGSSVYQGVVTGLKLLAVVVVADALLSMFNSFCRQWITRALALAMAALMLLVSGLSAQLLGLIGAALVGIFLLSGPLLSNPLASEDDDSKGNAGLNWLPLLLFMLLLLVSFYALAVEPDVWSQLFSAFYQAGSFVFGGGHVVLPMLQQSLGSNISDDALLMGYAAAQGVPGPMFTMASFMGGEFVNSSAISTVLMGAVLATLAVFLPGFLLLLGFVNAWRGWANKPKVAGAIAGVNAAVVGLLAAAFVNPVWVSAVTDLWHLVFVAIGFVLLRVIKVPVLWLVLLAILLGASLSAFS